MTLVREQFETNFFGPINIIKAALPVMRERKSGHIINLTGISEFLGTTRQVLIGPSKPPWNTRTECLLRFGLGH